MTSEQESALWEFQRASKTVASCLPFRSGGGGAEKKYAQAYQKCVQVGLFSQIKKKYR